MPLQWHLQETFSDIAKTGKTGLSKTAHTRWMISARLDDLPPGMKPQRLNPIEPRAFLRQHKCQQADTLLRLLHFPVMLFDPILNGSALVPASLIPKQDQYPFPCLLRFRQQPLRILNRQLAARIAFHKPQPDGFLLDRLFIPMHGYSITGYRFGFRVMCIFGLLM